MNFSIHSSSFPALVAVLTTILLTTSSVVVVSFTASISYRPHKSSPSELSSSVVSEFLSKSKPNTSNSDIHHNNDDADDDGEAQIKAFFERERPETVLDDQVVVVKHKIKTTTTIDETTTSDETTGFNRFALHSSAVTHLSFDMPMNDITRAIKRAQNLHDVHDLHTIGTFLIEECDKVDGWGYGYRGALLSRLAVAALHENEVDLALRAIETRQKLERQSSMEPYESAAIVRGLFRVGLPEQGWSIFNEELRIPTELKNDNQQRSLELFQYRSHALSSIATRYLYENKPKEAIHALQKLEELGKIVQQQSNTITMEELELDLKFWTRLERAAMACNNNKSKNISSDDDNDEVEDLREYVWNAMAIFN